MLVEVDYRKWGLSIRLGYYDYFAKEISEDDILFHWEYNREHPMKDVIRTPKPKFGKSAPDVQWVERRMTPYYPDAEEEGSVFVDEALLKEKGPSFIANWIQDQFGEYFHAHVLLESKSNLILSKTSYKQRLRMIEAKYHYIENTMKKRGLEC